MNVLVPVLALYVIGMTVFAVISLSEYLEHASDERKHAIRFLLSWAWPLFLLPPLVRLVRTALGEDDDLR